jgi:DNA-binding CsgD family transcriptional regulator
MFFTSESASEDFDHFWLSLMRTGSVFVIMTLSWTTILAGLLCLTLIQQPVWWITALRWGGFFLFLIVLHVWYIRSIPTWMQKHKKRFLIRSQEQVQSLQAADVHSLQDYLSSRTSQVAAAFELPFQRMGVRTENYRQEIEAAINALYTHEADQQSFSLCLHLLLQAAKQNWIDLAAFSPREREILELLLQNISYKEMSSRLHVSISTVKTHIYHIFQKLDISTREEAISLIRERGWFLMNERDLVSARK